MILLLASELLGRADMLRSKPSRVITGALCALALLYPRIGAAARLQSSSLPISVVYENPAHVEVAKATLVAAESAWTRLVDELGYAAPWTEDEGGVSMRGTVLHVASTGLGPGTATAMWSKDLPNTPACDCSSFLTIDPESRPDTDLREIVFHELVHATQYMATCTDPPSTYEGFAVAAQAKQFPQSNMVANVVDVFQFFPQYPLDYWTMNMPCDPTEPCFPYQLGAALFPLYLVDRFEGGEPRALGKLFASFGGPGTTKMDRFGPQCSVAHPAWLEIVRRYVEAHGTTFADAFDEFTVWRAITGPHDDGKHLLNARWLPTVAVAASHPLDPSTEEPIEGQLTVRELGTRYIELQKAPPGSSWSVTVDGASSAAWRASVLFWRAGEPVEVKRLVFDGASGALDFAVPGGATRALLVVSQLDDGEHLAELGDYDNERRFRYAIAHVVEAPPGEPTVPAERATSASASQPGGCGVSGLEPGANAVALRVLAGVGALAALRRWRRRGSTVSPR